MSTSNRLALQIALSRTGESIGQLQFFREDLSPMDPETRLCEVIGVRPCTFEDLGDWDNFIAYSDRFVYVRTVYDQTIVNVLAVPLSVAGLLDGGELPCGES